MFLFWLSVGLSHLVIELKLQVSGWMNRDTMIDLRENSLETGGKCHWKMLLFVFLSRYFWLHIKTQSCYKTQSN